MRKIVRILTLGFALIAAPTIAWADGDSSSDDPSNFGRVLSAAKGVMLRVPVNANGEENTNAVELRFHNGAKPSTDLSDAMRAWQESTKVDNSAELQGTDGPARDPKRDSSTWGWYNWCNSGWAYPYYYYYYYPTFYYNYNWYYYNYYSYWNWGGYRYYYYWW